MRVISFLSFVSTRVCVSGSLPLRLGSSQTKRNNNQITLYYVQGWSEFDGGEYGGRFAVAHSSSTAFIPTPNVNDQTTIHQHNRYQCISNNKELVGMLDMNDVVLSGGVIVTIYLVMCCVWIYLMILALD